MMIIKIINENTINISEIVESISWSGNEDEFARKLEIVLSGNVVNLYKIGVGNRIKCLDNLSNAIFDGYIIEKTIELNGRKLNLTCYDGLFHMMKSEVIKNYTKNTAEYITRDICKMAQIGIGNIASTGIVQDYPANGSLLEVIKEAYDYASSINKKRYKIYSKSFKLFVDEIGIQAAQYILKEGRNVFENSYTESMTDMVNKVKIYDDSGKMIGEISDSDSIKKYGLIQKSYTKEEGKEHNTVAKNMLNGLSKKLSIKAAGNIDCITGKQIVLESSDNLQAKLVITSDSHTFEKGNHIMQLELEFREVANVK